MEYFQSEDEKYIELEEHFILRLPQELADKVHDKRKAPPEDVIDNVKIQLDIEHSAGAVFVDDLKVDGKLRKLPTIVETYKKLENSMHSFYKTADISSVLDCSDDAEKDMDSGLTPPMKDVKTRRFRVVKQKEPKEITELKPFFKKDLNPDKDRCISREMRELRTLLIGDSQSTSTSFEFVDENDINTSREDEITLFGFMSNNSSNDD